MTRVIFSEYLTLLKPDIFYNEYYRDVLLKKFPRFSFLAEDLHADVIDDARRFFLSGGVVSDTVVSNHLARVVTHLPRLRELFAAANDHRLVDDCLVKVIHDVIKLHMYALNHVYDALHDFECVALVPDAHALRRRAFDIALRSYLSAPSN